MRTNFKNILSAVFLSFGIFLFASGCGGYQVAMSVPEHIQKIGIPNFANRSGQPDLDQELTREIRQTFIVDARLNVSDPENADALLEGTIQKYERLVLLRDENQVPQQYKLLLEVDLDFIDKKTGEVLWTTRRTVHLTPVTTATAQLDYDSTNYRTLKVATNYYVLNKIGMPPEEEGDVRRRLIEEMAERVFRRVIDGF